MTLPPAVPATGTGFLALQRQINALLCPSAESVTPERTEQAAAAFILTLLGFAETLASRVPAILREASELALPRGRVTLPEDTPLWVFCVFTYRGRESHVSLAREGWYMGPIYLYPSTGRRVYSLLHKLAVCPLTGEEALAAALRGNLDQQRLRKALPFLADALAAAFTATLTAHRLELGIVRELYVEEEE